MQRIFFPWSVLRLYVFLKWGFYHTDGNIVTTIEKLKNSHLDPSFTWIDPANN